MTNYNKKISDTNVRLGLVRFSFVNVFNRRRNPDGSAGKYSVCVLIPKGDADTVATFNYALENAKAVGKATKWNGRIPNNVKSPLRDGDVERPDDPAFKNCYFFNANTDNAPGVRVRDSGIVCEAMDAEDFYSGCYGAVTVNLYPYSVSGNVGIGAGLQNVIKIEDGERLSGGRSADADFADLG